MVSRRLEETSSASFSEGFEPNCSSVLDRLASSPTVRLARFDWRSCIRGESHQNQIQAALTHLWQSHAHSLQCWTTDNRMFQSGDDESTNSIALIVAGCAHLAEIGLDVHSSVALIDGLRKVPEARRASIHTARFTLSGAVDVSVHEFGRTVLESKVLPNLRSVDQLTGVMSFFQLRIARSTAAAPQGRMRIRQTSIDIRALVAAFLATNVQLERLVVQDHTRNYPVRKLDIHGVHPACRIAPVALCARGRLQAEVRWLLQVGDVECELTCMSSSVTVVKL